MSIQEQQTRMCANEKSQVWTPCFDFVQRSVSNKLLLNSDLIRLKEREEGKKNPKQWLTLITKENRLFCKNAETRPPSGNKRRRGGATFDPV